MPPMPLPANAAVAPMATNAPTPPASAPFRKVPVRMPGGTVTVAPRGCQTADD
jgi:hypothetical protein